LVGAAYALLEGECHDQIELVLQGDTSLLEAAKTARGRARLVRAYRAADLNDRRALVEAIGIDVAFDEIVKPFL
jgi:hypothetical protein